MKNPLTLAGIETATFRLVTQHLKRCATAVPCGIQYMGLNYDLFAEISLSQSTTILFDECRRHIEKLSDSKDINRSWEDIKENIKTSAKQSVSLYEVKQHKRWFGEEC